MLRDDVKQPVSFDSHFPFRLFIAYLNMARNQNKKKKQTRAARRAVLAANAKVEAAAFDLRRRGGGPSNALAVTTIATRRVRDGLVPARNADRVRAVCSFLDPFCAASIGARWPDGINGFTVPYRAVSYNALTPSAAGGMFLFAPDARAENYAKVFGAGATVVVPASLSAWAATNTFFNNFVSEVRVVSAGCRWIPTSAATTAGVALLLTEIAEPSTLFGSTLTLMDTSLGSNQKLVDHRVPFTFISKRADMLANNFQPSLSSTACSCDWPALLVQFVGSDGSTNLGYFEFTTNYEFVLQRTTAGSNVSLAQLSTPPPKEDLVVQRAVKRAGPTFNSILDAAAPVVSRIVESAAATALNYFLPGAGSAYRAIRDVD